MNEAGDQSEKEATQRRDALLLKLLKTPPQPRPKRERKLKSKSKKQPSAGLKAKKV